MQPVWMRIPLAQPTLCMGMDVSQNLDDVVISQTTSTAAALLASQGKNVEFLRSGSEYTSTVSLQTNQPGEFLSYNNLLKNR